MDANAMSTLHAYAHSANACNVLPPERRRARRRRFVQAVPIRLICLDGSESITAVLLNAGPAGLACRIEAADVGGELLIGRTLLMLCTIGPADEPCELWARVTHATAVATPGRLALGMEFLPDQMKAPNGARWRALLRSAEDGRETRVP